MFSTIEQSRYPGSSWPAICSQWSVTDPGCTAPNLICWALPAQDVRHHKRLATLSLYPFNMTHRYNHTCTHMQVDTCTTPAWALVHLPKDPLDSRVTLPSPFLSARNDSTHPFSPVFGRSTANFFTPFGQDPISYSRRHSKSLVLWFTIFSITI